MSSSIENPFAKADSDLVAKDCSISPEKNLLTISFFDETFTFHAQWLHDARYEHLSSKPSGQVYVQQLRVMLLQSAVVSGTGVKTTLDVTWENGDDCHFPAVWLRVLAPTVARRELAAPTNGSRNGHTKGPRVPDGWLANGLVMPEISYTKIMGDQLSDAEFQTSKAWILDTLLQDDAPGILKVTDLPPVDAYTESTQRNNLVTAVLKRLFGAVFQHQMRGPDETFKIASHYHTSANRIVELPNYDTNEVLLPHTDHSHYDNPVRVQGFHAVEGTSENTFIHAWACLATLRDESPALFDAILAAPMVLGRVAQFYSPALFQTTVDCAVRPKPGYPDQFKCIRWHPHLMGYLLAPFDSYETARRAQCKFEEIMYRDTHMVRTQLRPGDMYLWDNFRILHGRERIFDIPRIAVGQTVIEQVVNDEYRTVKMAFLTRHLSENWLVQTPTAELENLIRLIKAVDKGSFSSSG